MLMTERVRSMTRGEFFGRVGLIREADPAVSDAYRFFERVQEGEQDKGESVSDPWHVSFHGSQFPGDSQLACPRLALYRMIDAPREKPSRKLRMMAEMGKDHEMRLVEKLHMSGQLVSPAPWLHQMQFEEPEAWLTSTVDAIVCRPRATRPFVMEEKMKYGSVIEEMRKLIRGPDSKHVNQVKCQIAMAHIQGEWKVKRCHNSGRLAIQDLMEDNMPLRLDAPICPQHGGDKCLEDDVLEPVRHGYLHYTSRDNPDDTWEFYFEYDPAWYETGVKMLKLWREHFLRGILPQTNFEDKRYSHPFAWTWTRSKKMPESPCQWCDFGAICRLDHKDAVKSGTHVNLADSHAIDDAKAVRKDYEFEDARKAVLARWKLDEEEAKKAA
jgi:hypothetical protein